MADGVNIPAQGVGDATPKVSTQKVTADTSDVQDVSLTSVVAGVRTRNPVLTTTPGPALEVAFSTTIVQAVAATDVGAYAWVSVHILTQGGSSTVAFQGSNDNTNWLAVPLQNAGSTTATTATSNTGANIIFHGPLPFRYFRLNVTGIASGTTAGVIEFYSRPRASSSALTQATPADASSASLASSVAAFGLGWNGSNWDRLRATIANGLAVDVTRPVLAATATLANVSGSASSVTLQASNTARKGLVIVNDSTAILYVKFGSSASTTSFTYYLPGSVGGTPATLELPAVVYSGIVTGIWASAVGAARVTEIT